MQLPGANPGLADVWNLGDFTLQDRRLWMQAGVSPADLAGQYGLTHASARRLTNTLYHAPNPVFQAAVNLVAAFLVGDRLSFTPHPDRTVRQVVEEFYQVNALGEYMTQRAVLEYLLDGELAMVWNRDSPKDLTARVGALDVNRSVTVQGNLTRGLVAADIAEKITFNKDQPDEQSWNAGEFVWVAYGALHNSVRGWPPTLAAAMASAGAVSLINSRLRANDLLSRLLGVYKAFLDPNGRDASGKPDGGLSAWLAKARSFSTVPEDGAVVPLVVKPGYSVTEQTPSGMVTTKYDGVSESLEFPNPSPGAGDAASDLRALIRLVGLTLGLPEHYMGEGGSTTRTTADSMTLPAVKIVERHQAFLRGFMDRIIRTELLRRYGPDRLYTTYVIEKDASGLTQKRRRRRVPADLIEVPWVMPVISPYTLDELIRLGEAAEAHGWASSQTIASSFGYDTAAEAELMAAAGRAFGNATPDAAPATGQGGEGDVPSPPDPGGSAANPA